jgi:hypothetical protein
MFKTWDRWNQDSKNYSPNWYHVYRAAGCPKSWEEADRLWRAHCQTPAEVDSGARRVLAA